jgi:hypothetical protein
MLLTSRNVSQPSTLFREVSTFFLTKSLFRFVRKLEINSTIIAKRSSEVKEWEGFVRGSSLVRSAVHGGFPGEKSVGGMKEAYKERKSLVASVSCGAGLCFAERGKGM